VRPAQCVCCDGERVWFNGWRRVLVTLLVDGQPSRLTDWLPLQRVRCAQPPCGRSWTLRPPWLYPHRSLEPDLAETAALTYLADPQATYRSVAQRVGCSWVTVWRWISWLATLITPAAVLARVARLAPHGAEPGLLPRAVAAAARARSRRRRAAGLSGPGGPDHAPPGAARAGGGPEPAPLVSPRRVPRVPAAGPADPVRFLPGV